MSSEADITWRNILLLCGATISVCLAANVWIMSRIDAGYEKQQELKMRNLQVQIDFINDRLNASNRDLEKDE